jgi:hypothetical protein
MLFVVVPLRQRIQTESEPAYMSLGVQNLNAD